MSIGPEGNEPGEDCRASLPIVSASVTTLLVCVQVNMAIVFFISGLALNTQVSAPCLMV